MGNSQHRFLLFYVSSLLTQGTNGGFKAIQVPKTTAQPTTPPTTTVQPTTPPTTPNLIKPYTAKLKNLAVHEGQLDTVIYFPSCPLTTYWLIDPASESKEIMSDIVTYDHVVNPNFTADYEFSLTGLTIKNATIHVHPGHQISTAGFYIAHYFADYGFDYRGFKFLVVQSGPLCSRLQSNSSSEIKLSCSVTYADAASFPIYAIMKWIVNGALYATDQPNRIMTDQQGLYTATSIITINDGTLENYQCMLTFSGPQDFYYDYLSKEAPEFNESCSTMPVLSNINNEPTTTVQPTLPPTTPSYCFPNLRNIVVREGQLDVLLNVTATPCSASWLIYPTSNEMDGVQIVESDCTQDSSIASLYNVNGSGLIIRNSTTDNIGRPLSTSGLYVAQCNDNGLQAGMKFVVVRSGPECSCQPNVSSSSVTLSCSVVYADYTIHPIPAVFTWIVNGKKYSTEVPSRNRSGFHAFPESTITVDGRTLNDYKCILTFGEPRDIEYDYIAMNAPEYEDSCSTPRC